MPKIAIIRRLLFDIRYSRKIIYFYSSKKGMTPFWYEGLELFRNWTNLIFYLHMIIWWSALSINEKNSSLFMNSILLKRYKTRVEASSLRNLKILPRTSRKLSWFECISVRNTDFPRHFAKIFAGREIFRKISVGLENENMNYLREISRKRKILVP